MGKDLVDGLVWNLDSSHLAFLIEVDVISDVYSFPAISISAYAAPSMIARLNAPLSA